MFWLWLLKLGPNLEPLRGPLLWTRIHFFELNQGRGGVWCPVAAWVYQVKISYTVWFLLQDFFWRSVRLFFSPQVLHSAGASHISLWTATIQKCDCEWTCPGKAGALPCTMMSSSSSLFLEHFLVGSNHSLWIEEFRNAPVLFLFFPSFRHWHCFCSLSSRLSPGSALHHQLFLMLNFSFPRSSKGCFFLSTWSSAQISLCQRKISQPPNLK